MFFYSIPKQFHTIFCVLLLFFIISCWLRHTVTLFRRDAALCGWGNAVTFGSGGSADLAKGYHIFAAKAAYCRRDAASQACR
jgi:hypothetical protein